MGIKRTRVVDNFKTINYHREFTPSTKKNNWLGSPLGCAQKILIGLIGDEMCGGPGDVAISRRFPPIEELFNRFIFFCPWAFEEYKGEHLLDNKVIKDRYHKMYYKNLVDKELRGRQSEEHYLNSSQLRPWVSVIDALFLKGKPISKEQILNVMQNWRRIPTSKVKRSKVKRSKIIKSKDLSQHEESTNQLF